MSNIVRIKKRTQEKFNSCNVNMAYEPMYTVLFLSHAWAVG